MAVDIKAIMEGSGGRNALLKARHSNSKPKRVSVYREAVRMTVALMPSEFQPSWFSYPQQFLKYSKDVGHCDIGAWQIFEAQSPLVARFEGLKRNYPKRSLVPFARRVDSDDLACWGKETGGFVLIIHDYASFGWEQRETFSSFNAWLKIATEECY